MGERLAAALRDALRADPDDRCLEFDGEWWTRGELAGQVAALDGELTAAGFGPDAAVGVMMRNDPATVVAVVALLSTQRTLIVFRAHLPPDARRADVVARGVSALIDGGLSVLGAPGDGPSMPGVAVEMLTSGTTGPPKRVPLLYTTLEASILDGAARPSSDARIVWAPMTHLGGIWGVLQTLLGGQQLVLMERFEVDGWVKRVRDHRPAVTGLPPAGLRQVLDADVDAADLSSLRAITTGTAPVKPELVTEFEARYDIPVLVTYGATEFAGPIAGWTVDDRRAFGATKVGSVGRPYAGVETRVVDGVLEVRGARLGEAWLRTSDFAHVDEDGFVYIDGRADDAIVRGGFKVSAGAVAAVLEEHPSVGAAAVVGLPDERLGEVPVAAVEAAVGGPAPDPAALDAFLRERLPSYQVPVTIRVVDELPRNPTLKVDAVAVRRLFS
ncbi:MAG TPA: long-chain fatty acid--CoA ligase [Acidimicrobiales bacterium]|nr:long-chain fatty acid--CoA ligase [Acidimicrobiales bacterium]